MSRPRGERTVVVFDLDGTVCDDSVRCELFAPWAVADFMDRDTAWDCYYAAMSDDTPIEPVFRIARALVDMGFELHAATGRPTRYRQQTVQWMLAHDFPACTEIHMRPNGSRVGNAAIKVNHAMAIGPERIALWVDDHPEVPAVLAPLGIPVLSLGNPFWEHQA